jgi:hypothetical protein
MSHRVSVVGGCKTGGRVLHRFSVQVMFSVMIRMEAHRFSVQVMFSVMIRMEAQATYACVDDLSSRPCYTQPGVYFSQRQ